MGVQTQVTSEHYDEGDERHPRRYQTLDWAFTTLITLVLLYVGVYYEMPLWLQLVPIVVAMLGAVMVDRSWRCVTIVLGVTLLMYITYYLRHYGPL